MYAEQKGRPQKNKRKHKIDELNKGKTDIYSHYLDDS